MWKMRAPSPSTSPILVQPRATSSAPSSPLLAALSSTPISAPSTALVRTLTWLFCILLLLVIGLYTVYQLYHVTLAQSLDQAYSYRRLQAHYSRAPLASPQPYSDPPSQQPQPTQPPPPTTPSTQRYQPSFAILVLGDTTAATRYQQHWTSLACYANRHNYTFITDNNDRTVDPHPCSRINNFFFRKHCMVATIMLARKDIDWWLVLDGDVFVVNSELRLESWLSNPIANPHLEHEYVIYHYERFHNGEIMAGNYIVGNNQHAIDYLMGWSNWYNKIPSHTFHNYDNGALHMHLLSYIVGADSEEYRQVLDMYNTANSWAQYDAFVGAFRCVIGRHRLWPKLGLRIIRRGHFAVRDFFVSSEGDRIAKVSNIGVVAGGELMYHGWKESIVGVWWSEAVDSVKCMAEREWTPKLVDSVRVDMSELLRVVRERERYTVTDRGNAVAMQDVSDCFPQCPAELTVAQGEVMRERLCPPALKEKFVKEKDKAAVGAG